jgi:hypothetical protein
MPVNFREIQSQIRKMGQLVPVFEKELDERREQARQLLQQYAEQVSALRKLVEHAADVGKGLRCAVPAGEPLTFCKPTPEAHIELTLLAADGSQINPNHHDPVEFGVINVGAIRLKPGQNYVPEEITSTALLYGEAIETNGGPLTEEFVALMRDLNERQLLARLARSEQPPVITLTDGPLEPFREPDEDPSFRKSFNEYLDVLHGLAGQRVVTAGYVDKPRSDLVVRLLELTMLPEEKLSKAGQERPLKFVRDADLFYDLLAPGERSAVFSIRSSSSPFFKDELALHFFYLNVGRVNHPWLARVEVPEWVVGASDYLDSLHTVLVDQCQYVGVQSYPYALLRAHEVALVTYAEKQQLEDMILAELRQQGVKPGEKSHKQYGKDHLAARKRYPR